MNFDVPILFITYKRFRTAIRVFNQIKIIKPSKLYFVSNQAKTKQDIKNVKKVRNLLKKIDWDCKVMLLYQKEHLPVSKSIPSAIDFLFKHEKHGIILEDDCLPSKDFFLFCKKMLKKYKNNKKINAICGSRLCENDDEAYLSKYNHVWGWATWKRSWKYFDPEIKFWTKFKKSRKWDLIHSNKIQKSYWNNIFNKTYKKKLNTWDYAWTACAWYKNQLSIIPPRSLIQNIGNGPDATWTVSKKKRILKKEIHINKDIVYAQIQRNKILDKEVFLNHFNGKYYGYNDRLIYILKTLIKDPLTFYYKCKRIFLSFTK